VCYPFFSRQKYPFTKIGRFPIDNDNHYHLNYNQNDNDYQWAGGERWLLSCNSTLIV
jgi:hypothetical protein